MTQRELLQVLEKTASQSLNDQRLAIDYLKQVCITNFREFIKQLSSVLSNKGCANFVGQAAGLQLKNLVGKEEATKTEYLRRWLTLPESVRHFMRQNVVRTLRTEAFRPSIAAQCVAAIACAEVPSRPWPEIIACLQHNITATNTGMLKESCIENERYIIMQVACETLQCPKTPVKVVAMQYLARIMSLYYRFMKQFMSPVLFPVTLDAMNIQTDDVALQGIRIWSNVCEKEMVPCVEAEEAQKQRRTPEQVSRHYAKGTLPHLIPILTETLVKQEETDDDDDWIRAKAAGVCMMLLAQCTSNAIVVPILRFVQQHFKNPGWRYREAAIMALGSVLDGPDEKILVEVVEQAIGSLIEALGYAQAISSLAKAAYDMGYQTVMDYSGRPETYIISPCFEAMISELIEPTDRPTAVLLASIEGRGASLWKERGDLVTSFGIAISPPVDSQHIAALLTRGR